MGTGNASQGVRLLVLVLAARCSAPLEVGGRREAWGECDYNTLTDKPFPYPYEKHHWFHLLRRANMRAPPVRLRKLVTSAEPGKVEDPLRAAQH